MKDGEKTGPCSLQSDPKHKNSPKIETVCLQALPLGDQTLHLPPPKNQWNPEETLNTSGAYSCVNSKSPLDRIVDGGFQQMGRDSVWGLAEKSEMRDVVLLL